MTTYLLENSLTAAQLAQSGLFGIPTGRLLAWVMIALAVALVILLGIRLIRWMLRLGTGRTSPPPAPAQPWPKTESPRNVPVTAPPVERTWSAVTPERDPLSVQPADSILAADFVEPVAAETSKVRITNRAEIAESRYVDPPQAAAVAAPAIASSREARAFAGKERSWTSRSLFGNPITGVQQELPRLEPGQIPFSDTADYQFGSVTPALAALLPEGDSRKKVQKKELIEAGYYNPHAYENLAATRYLGLILPLIVFGILLVFGPPQLEPVMLVLMVVGAIVGWAVPRLMVRARAAKRRREIEQSLPDVIDLLNMCVSQGMTLRSALARVSWEISDTFPAMAEELRIVAEQADLGTLSHALNNMNERVDVPELHSLSSLLIQTDRMGTNVSDSLTEYSDGMRATLQQRADQKANAATFKLLFPTVLCLMPAVYFFLLGPAIIELSEFFSAGGLDRYRQVDVRSNQGNQ